jgi:hypothetical protein
MMAKKELLEVLADVPDDTPISSCGTGPLVVYRPAERDPDGVGLVTIDTADADTEEYWPEEKGWKILYGCPCHDARYRESAPGVRGRRTRGLPCAATASTRPG